MPEIPHSFGMARIQQVVVVVIVVVVVVVYKKERFCFEILWPRCWWQNTLPTFFSLTRKFLKFLLNWASKFNSGLNFFETHPTRALTNELSLTRSTFYDRFFEGKNVIQVIMKVAKKKQLRSLIMCFLFSNFKSNGVWSTLAEFRFGRLRCLGQTVFSTALEAAWS